MASTSENMDDLASQFVSITGADTETATHLLEACKGDLQMAIGMHMDGSGLPRGGDGGETSTAPVVVDGEDEIRAPIPQRTEMLVDEEQAVAQQYTSYVGGSRRRPRSVFDGFRDFRSETEQAEERLRPGVTRVGVKKKRTLEDLFRPPVDLIHKGSFLSAKKAGTDSNRWLLVNIQNVQEFTCQVLNRDVWSNPAVRDLVNFHFIFWQVYSDSEEGKRFMQFYNIDKWPYVAILDPITGEKFMEWDKMDAATFIELVNTFIVERPRPDSTSESPPAKRTRLEASIVEASEDHQLEAAIQASMKQNQTITLSSDDEDQSGSEVDLETFTDSDSDNDPVFSSPAKTKKPSQKVLPELTTTSDSESENESEKVNDSKKKSTGKGKALVNSRTPVKNGRHKTHSLAEEVINVESLPSTSDSLPSTTSDSLPSNSNSDSCQGTEVDANPQESQSSTTSWKDHLGQETDEKTKLLLRFPDGKREPLTIPCTSKLKLLTEYVTENKIDLKHHELVTNFPRRTLSSMDLQQTLEEAGLHPQETVFIQEKS